MASWSILPQDSVAAESAVSALPRQRRKEKDCEAPATTADLQNKLCEFIESLQG